MGILEMNTRHSFRWTSVCVNIIANMDLKKLALSAGLVLAFLGYSVHNRFDQEETKVVAPNGAKTSATTSVASSVTYKDGVYTGQVADAFYGDLQVKAVVSKGKISDVQFLKYPNDRGESIQINTQAMPYLKAEAIAAQSAQVDIVTGATQTSEAFRVTLGSALAQAQ